MKIITFIIFSMLLVGCGREDYGYQEDYFQGEWRRNDTKHLGDKNMTSKATSFLMPNTKEVDASVVITVPLDNTVYDCYNARILSKDGSKYLYYDYYKVLDCYENNRDRSKVDVVIKFSMTPAAEVYFDYL